MTQHTVRRPVIAGNWKMNMTPDEATSFFGSFVANYDVRDDRTIIFFPPALTFAAAAAAVATRQDLAFGVQNLHWERSGAFTGEVSAEMAAAAGARYALAGHSERRHVFGETDEQVGLKAAAALRAGLVPIACVGETLEERQAGRLREVLLRQLGAVLDAVPAADLSRVLLAYEPVWAIGTGVNATPADAAEAHALLRQALADRAGPDLADALPILYGGSVKPDNAAELLAAEGVDGLLVGGASLDPDGFARIAAA
jgi:triosephosphate isomerase (TIM)